MEDPEERLAWSARSLLAGAVLLAAAAAFHLVAAPHIPGVLRRIRDPLVYAFVEPIVSFTFLLNSVLLVPLAFSTWRVLGRSER